MSAKISPPAWATSITSARRLLFVGSMVALAGVAYAAIDGSIYAGAVLLAGWCTAGWGLHRFGRMGVDAPPT